MKKTLAGFVATCFLLGTFAMTGMMAAAAPTISSTEDENTLVSGDFTATVTAVRGEDDLVVGGIVFYRNDDTNSQFNFYVRCDGGAGPARVDFYGEKFVNGQWGGFLIAEEYESTGKDCFVSVDDGWDATTDEAFTLSVKVVGNLATVRMTGETTKKYGELTFDLTKAGTAEKTAATWNSGYVYSNFSSGSVGNLSVEIPNTPTTTTTVAPTTAATSATTASESKDSPATGSSTPAALIVTIMGMAAVGLYASFKTKKTHG